MLAHPSPEHGCGDVTTTAFLLCFVQHPQNHALLARQPVAYVGEKIPDVPGAGVSQGLNSVFSFFFTPTPLSFTYTGRP